MAQYQVPQFIEVEDKIFGPLTLKQFIYLAGAGGLALLAFTLLPLLLALPFIGLAAGMGAGLAFFKVNGRPLIVAVEHAFAYFFGKKLYLWKQREEAPAAAPKQAAPAGPTTLIVPRLSQSRLKDLSWSLNIKERAQASEAPPQFEL